MFKPRSQAIRLYSHIFVSSACKSKAESVSLFSKACQLIEQCRDNILMPNTQNKAFEAVEQLKKLGPLNISPKEKAEFENLCYSNAKCIIMNRHGEEPALEILGFALKVIPDSEKIQTLIHGIATDFYGNEKIQKRYLEIGKQFSQANKVRP